MTHVVRFYRSATGRWYGRCGCGWFSVKETYQGVKMASWSHERQGALL